MPEDIIMRWTKYGNFSYPSQKLGNADVSYFQIILMYNWLALLFEKYPAYECKVITLTW